MVIGSTTSAEFLAKIPKKSKEDHAKDQGEMKMKKTRHAGDEGTVAFWLYMKALYKDEE